MVSEQNVCRRAEPCGRGEHCERDEEEPEEEDFAGEPGAAPHLESSPGVGGAAEMKYGDVEREGGEGEDEGEGDGTGVVREKRGDESAGGELDERGHPDERPVRMLGAKGFDVDALEGGGGILGKRDASGGDGVSGGGHAGGVGGGVVAAPLELIDDLDFDGVLGAGVDAGGFEAGGEAAVAHVAFADDAALGVELRDGVGAVPDAVLAADAGVGGVQDDAGDGIFFVGIDGAALRQSAERQ